MYRIFIPSTNLSKKGRKIGSQIYQFRDSLLDSSLHRRRTNVLLTVLSYIGPTLLEIQRPLHEVSFPKNFHVFTAFPLRPRAVVGSGETAHVEPGSCMGRYSSQTVGPVTRLLTRYFFYASSKGFNAVTRCNDHLPTNTLLKLKERELGKTLWTT